VLGVSFSGSLIDDVLEGDEDVASASDAWERLGEFVERDPHTPGAFRFRHAPDPGRRLRRACPSSAAATCTGAWPR
jgi:hypothetical protein